MQYPEQLKKHPIYNFTLDLDLVSVKHKHDSISSYYHVFNNEHPTLDMHIHNFFEINIILDNPITHYINNQIYTVSPGTIFVIPPNIEHGYFSDKDVRVIHILLSNQFLAEHSDRLLSLKGYPFLFNVEPLMRSNSQTAMFLTLSPNEFDYISMLAKRLIEYEDLSNKHRTFMKELLTLSLISEICLYTKAPSRSNETFPEISAAIIFSMEYMNTHLSEKINLNHIAHMVNMSYSTYSRHFKQMCQCTPVQYLATLKTNRAAILLQQKSASISEVAQLCGFFDVSHFSRIFKRAYGISPNEFKKRNVSD